jgi:hypothetical protein
LSLRLSVIFRAISFVDLHARNLQASRWISSWDGLH